MYNLLWTLIDDDSQRYVRRQSLEVLIFIESTLINSSSYARFDVVAQGATVNCGIIVLHSLTSWQCIAADLEDALPGRCAVRSGAVRCSWIRGAGGVPLGEHVRIAAQRMFELRFREPPVRRRERRSVIRMRIYDYLSCDYSNIEKRRARGGTNIERIPKSASAQNKSGSSTKAKSVLARRRCLAKKQGVHSRCQVDRQVFRGLFIFTTVLSGGAWLSRGAKIRPAQTCTRI
jgi:hypothetical protein